MNENISCTECDRTFSARKNYYRHMRKFHPAINIEYFRASILCPCCYEKYPVMSSLHDHIAKNHKDVKLHFENLTFYTEGDFLEWKSATESETISKFISKSGQVEIDQHRKKTYFYCHRSGSENIKIERKRRLKFCGSNKMGFTCPAIIAVTEQKDGDLIEIKVKYQATHYGHRNEFTWRPVSIVKKSSKFSQMSSDVPKSEISKGTASLFSSAKRVSYVTDTVLNNIHTDVKVEEEESLLYQFSCTCPEYAIRNVICKHIHLVARNYNKEDHLIVNVDDSFDEKPIIISRLAVEKESSDLEEDRSKAIEFLDNFMNYCKSSDATSDELKIIIDSFTDLNEKIELKKSDQMLKMKSQQPLKKKIKKQKQFTPLDSLAKKVKIN